MEFWVNCQPGVVPDPINGSFDAKYTNTGTAAGSLKITSTRMSMKSPGGNTMDWKFDVNPTQSGSVPAGKSLTTNHKKVFGSGKGSGAPCGYCGGEWTLNVTWTDGSQTIPMAAKASKIQCAH